MFFFLGVSKKSEYGAFLKVLFHTPNFRINVVKDAHTVELCGALKVGFYICSF